MSGDFDYHPIEDFISTYPETQKVIEELNKLLMPVKEYLTSLKMKDNSPLISEVVLDLSQKPRTFLTSITFNDSAFLEKSL